MQEGDAVNRHRYAEHRIPTSLERHVGRSSDSDTVRRYAEQVYHQDRGAFFTKEQLAQMHWQHRAVIETELRRIFGNRRA